MTSPRQWAANRRNAIFSTGPRTLDGKLKSRENAIRHGLTAETVIGALEDPEEYRAFEAQLLADYAPQTEIGCALVYRLVSLLWRLRRVTIVETGLWEIQAERGRECQLGSFDTPDCTDQADERASEQGGDPPRQIPETILAWRQSGPVNSAQQPRQSVADPRGKAGAELARCFLRLSHLENRVLDRLSRYEVNLWRQTVQTILALETLGDQK